MLLRLLLALLLLTPPALAGKGSSGGGGGGRPSFSGGSSSPKPSFGGSSPKPSFSGGSSSKPSAPQASGKPTFSGGSSPAEGRTPTSVSKKPAADSFDKLSGTEARKAESRQSYQKAETPAATYKTSAGKEVKVDTSSKSTAYLRGRLDESHWQTRYQRTDTFYGGYSSRPVMVYNDFYHPMWNYWLMSQTIDAMSLWVYHHQATMDQARLNAMYAQNGELRARVAALEKQGVVRDATYTPSGVDPDLMYDDNYVNAVYNPVPKEKEEGTDWHLFWKIMRWVFVYIPLAAVLMYGLYFLLFKHRY